MPTLLLRNMCGQEPDKVTHAAKLTKEEAHLDFAQDAATNHNKVIPSCSVPGDQVFLWAAVQLS